MLKKPLLAAIIAAIPLFCPLLIGQHAKRPLLKPGLPPAAERLRLNPWPEHFPKPSEHLNALGGPVSYPSFGVLPSSLKSADEARFVQARHAHSGLPIWFAGVPRPESAAEAERPIEVRALAYVNALRPEGIQNPQEEFIPNRMHQDELGNWHVRLQQVYRGVPVYGAEVIAHTQNGTFSILNGRYYPTPKIGAVVPSISVAEAVERVRAHVGPHKTSWTEAERALVGGQEVKAELVIYHPKRQLGAERLAWFITFYTDLIHRKAYFVDAHSGDILHHFDNTPYTRPFAQAPAVPLAESWWHPGHTVSAASAGGPVVATGLDLKNINRTFGGWQEGNTVYMIDASLPMFNAGASKMPEDPVGAVVTLDAKKTSPFTSTFDFSFVTSPSTVFTNQRSAVSAHWGSLQAYNYWLNTFNWNSYDGKGASIYSFVRVAEEDGGGMDNAFWNGFAAFYGEGRTFFFDLAGALDVVAHELGHAVIEHTANLEYQDESGALNESYADILAVGVDRDEWLIGDGIVRPGIVACNCLRDMQFPKNGIDPQPEHMNEKYVGPDDFGGVHINSGIVNRAFVLFATHPAVGLDKAERVFFKALRDYLVKSSEFFDGRLAVIQSANELYGSVVADAAASAFDAVGIVGGQPTNPFGLLSENPGTGLIVSVSNNGALLDLHRENGAFVKTLYNQGVASRPSVSDDGRIIVFVNPEGHIIAVSLEQVGNTFSHEVYQLSQFPEWRNVAISKDGRFLAALTGTPDNTIYVFDLTDPQQGQIFELYNPTTSPNQSTTKEVQYADVLEFDYSGEYIMYDAFNQLTSSTGQVLEYWDIGFMRFWDKSKGQFTSASKPPITKLFSAGALPPGVSVGNPVFSQRAPFVIAFDGVDENENAFDVVGNNVQTGALDVLVADNGALGWPTYTRTDDAILFERLVGNQYNIYRQGVAPDRIKGVGPISLLISAHYWPRWFAYGTRSLSVSTSSPQANASLQLKVNPNPMAGDRVRLSFDLTQGGPVHIEVTDLLGRRIHLLQQELPAGPQQVELHLQQLPSGTYSVRLGAANGAATTKVIKP